MLTTTMHHASRTNSTQGWGTDIPTIALRLAAEPKKSGTRARVVVFTQVGGCVFMGLWMGWWGVGRDEGEGGEGVRPHRG